jgi:hypothetical protein
MFNGKILSWLSITSISLGLVMVEPKKSRAVDPVTGVVVICVAGAATAGLCYWLFGGGGPAACQGPGNPNCLPAGITGCSPPTCKAAGETTNCTCQLIASCICRPAPVNP